MREYKKGRYKSVWDELDDEVGYELRNFREQAGWKRQTYYDRKNRGVKPNPEDMLVLQRLFSAKLKTKWANLVSRFGYQIEDFPVLPDADQQGQTEAVDDRKVSGSALSVSAQKPTLPPDIEAAIKRGDDFFNAGHFKKGKVQYQRALALAEGANHSLAIVKAKQVLALVIIRFERDTAAAKALLESCLDLLSKDDNDKERARVLDTLAHLHEQAGDLELSESLQRQSLAISERLANKLSQAGTLVNLGWTVGRRGRTDEALELNRKAYDLLIQVLHGAKLDDTRDFEFTHSVLGNLFFQRAKIHQRRAEPDEAEKALETALEWQRKMPPSHELAKILQGLAELKFFRQEWDPGATLLWEAAKLYEEREMLPELAGCLHLMGRVHASIGNLEKAGELFSNAAAAAAQSGRSQEAAEILQSLAQLAKEQGDANSARQLLQNAKEASEEAEFQAECLMALRDLTAKEGHEDERRRLMDEAVDLLKADLARTKPEMERAQQLFTLGWYLREAGQFEEALGYVRKASLIFEAAHDAFGAARAKFEAVGLLERVGRKQEARELCRSVHNMIESKPFFEIAAAVDISLAKFALYDDKNLAEAQRFVDHGLELCKQHDLPLLREALLLKDEIEGRKRIGTETAASIGDLLNDLHQQLALCPANSEGYLRLWMFCLNSEIASALRATLGPNVAILSDDLDEFLHLSAVLKPYRDWSLIVPPQKYPDDVFESVLFAANMLIPANGIAFMGVKKNAKIPDDPEEFRKKVHLSPEDRASLSLARLSTGGAIPRYIATLETNPEQHDGVWAWARGPSLALPPAVHELLQGRDVEELKAHRLFFVYYNRGLVDEDKRLWYDMAILHRFRCFPIYRGALPRSEKVRVVASCPVGLPVLTEKSADRHKRALRDVRRALLEVLAANATTAAGKLSDLAGQMEDLVAEAGAESTLRLALYVLEFEDEGNSKTHAAIVLK